MTEGNRKKGNVLGMPHGTACNKLRKLILFDLLKQLNKNVCYQCGEEINNEKELSIEHRTPYLNSKDPLKLFFDLENISFSHLSCNCSAANKDRTKLMKHPSSSAYDSGRCRCDKCKEIKKLKQRSWRERNNKKEETIN